MQITPKESPGDPLRRLLLSLPPFKKHVQGGSSPRYKAVIYEVQRLGDFLLAMKSIEILLAHFGAENCALAVSPESMPLAQEIFPDIPKITVPLMLAGGGWNLFDAVRLKRELAAFSCENLICLRHHRSALASAILRWIPANIRWGIIDHPWMSAGARKAETDLFLHQTPYTFPAEKGIPAEVEANAALVSMVTGEQCRAGELLPEFPLEGVVPAKKIPTLAIAPWGSNNMSRIPEELLAEILLRLTAKVNFKVVIMAAPGDRERTAGLVESLRTKIIGSDISHASTPDLKELMKQISLADAVLACDSFPAHLSIAFDRPTAVLITGASPGLFGPWGSSGKQRWFRQEKDCCGCGWRCIHPRPLCLTEISPQEVAEFLFGQLRKVAK